MQSLNYNHALSVEAASGTVTSRPLVNQNSAVVTVRLENGAEDTASFAVPSPQLASLLKEGVPIRFNSTHWCFAEGPDSATPRVKELDEQQLMASRRNQEEDAIRAGNAATVGAMMSAHFGKC